MSMVRYIVICTLLSGINLAHAADQTAKGTRFSLPELPNIPESVQQLRVDATAAQPDAVKDPFQRFNRQVYRFNDAIDRRVLLPTAKFYQRVVPQPINTGISNFFQNISEPWTAVNQLLQGKPKASAQSLGRFTLNTLTSLGFADPAESSFSLKAGDEDFGQTLGVWGVKSGPYIVLPLLGPSTLRDVTGRVLDMAASPTVYVEPDQARAVLTATNIVDTRAEFIGAESLVTGDQYPVLRDVYLQRRLFAVYDGAVPARLNPPVEEGFGDEAYSDGTESGTPAVAPEGSDTQPTPAAPQSPVKPPPASDTADPTSTAQP